EVEQKCLSSWYDVSNKKTVCERFEPPSRCVGSRVRKRFCIDAYDWPNKKGERPEVMNRFHQAQVKCAAVGRRLCTESEWTFACEGPQMKPFPYGYVRDAKKCRGDMPWDHPDMKRVAARDPEELGRLWQGVPNGAQPECISDFGVADLPGNTDEVVASETFEPGWRGEFDSVNTGGPWYKGVRNQCRPKIYTHNEGFYYYYLSFRCCAEADGKATEPRTPKQIRQNWKFERVEKSAGFTRAEIKEILQRKTRRTDCGCSVKDVRCKTMCGSLLGPNAVDTK
ncbi:MAG TPA: SUMF1/EgtB/PvdO family nonheme iron enzyme, partial [Polyangiaceae bacterium]